jgi:hypothetical protein
VRLEVITQPRGRPVTAHDLVFALKRLADAKLASSGYWLIDGRIRGIATSGPTRSCGLPKKRAHGRRQRRRTGAQRWRKPNRGRP